MKFFLLLPVALVPYSVLLALFCVFNQVFGDIMPIIIFLLVLWLVAIMSAVIYCILAVKRKWDAVALSKVNMVLKVVHIPAYIAIFVLGVLFIISIFTAGFSFLFVLVDLLSIFLTGLIGIPAVISAYRVKYIPKKALVLHTVCQFMFCIDILSSVLLYKKVKKKHDYDIKEQQEQLI